QNTSFGGDSFEMVLTDQLKSHAQSSTRPTYRRMARSTNLNVSISAACGQCQTTKRQYKMTIP
ncbi:hypothetical protein HID58_059378, partial [Brassica napus]